MSSIPLPLDLQLLEDHKKGGGRREWGLFTLRAWWFFHCRALSYFHPWRHKTSAKTYKSIVNNTFNYASVLVRSKKKTSPELYMQYLDFIGPARELFLGDPLKKYEEEEVIEGIPREYYAADFLIFTENYYNTIAEHIVANRFKKRKEAMPDVARPNIYRPFPTREESSLGYISRLIYAEMHPVRRFMRSNGLTRQDLIPVLLKKSENLWPLFRNDSIMIDLNLQKLKNAYPQLDITQLRRDFHIWKATDWQRDPVEFSIQAMQIFAEDEELLRDKHKKKG